MKALSLWQPWAAAMAEGVKRNETRGRLTHVRGDVVICSARRAARLGEYTGEWVPPILLYGCALCVVELYGCVPVRDPGLYGVMTDLERGLGNYSDGRFIWLTRNLRKLRHPVPVKGHQGFWNLTAEEETAVTKEMP